MSGGGGKGGSQTTKSEIPAWVQQPAQRALQRGEDISRIGYTPYMGPDVAAFTQPQIDSMQNTSDAASAFGMASSDPMAGMPEPQTFAGGVQGYSSYPLYEETLKSFKNERPGQYDYMQSFFIDPSSGRQRGGGAGQTGVAPPFPGQASTGQAGYISNDGFWVQGDR